MTPDPGTVVVAVDDDPALLDALRRTLRLEPYKLLLTCDPSQALAWAEDYPVRVFISDQRMKCVRGSDLLDRVHRVSPQTRLLMLTAYPDLRSFLQRADRTIHAVLMKPWNASEIRSLIRSLSRTEGAV